MCFHSIKSILPIILMLTCLTACGTDVGGNEDKTAPVVTLTSLDEGNGGEDVVGTFIITWDNNEPNRSYVDIESSSDSGKTWQRVEERLADSGTYPWNTNTVEDCRTCRIRITATDVVGNVSAPVESADDFIINNVPQVLGAAFYTDIGNDGPGDLDRLRVPFDKDLELLTGIASDIFIFPVLGDSIGPFATVVKGAKQNEVVITFNELLINSDFHLHVDGKYYQDKLTRTLPSGLNIFDNLAEGILFAKSTGRTAQPSVNGIDITPTFNHSDHALPLDLTYAIAGALGDIDGDGDLDYVVASSDLINGTISTSISNQVFLNNEPSNLGHGVYTDSGQNLVIDDLSLIRSLVLGDLDNDGDLDLIAGSTKSVLVWMNNGSGAFTYSNLAGHTLNQANANSLVLGDIDDDSDLDLVAMSRVWINDGNANFTHSGQSLENAWTQSVVLGDVDGDKDLDLVFGNNGANHVWLNDRDGNFTYSGQVGHTLGNNNTQSLALGDIDGDDDLDIVAGNYITKPNRLWINDGTGNFTSSDQMLGVNGLSVTLIDVDGDNDLDLSVFAGQYNDHLIFLNDDRGNFTNSGMEFDRANSYYSTDSFGDIDNDGDLDYFYNGSFWLYSQKFPGRGFIDSLLGYGNGVSSVTLDDLDSDGDLDFVTAGSDNQVFFNNGSGDFTLSQTFLIDTVTNSVVALGDVDEDGDIDLIRCTADSEGIRNNQADKIFLNNGHGVFNDTGQTLGNDYTRVVTTGDVDGDGDLDIISSTGDYDGASGPTLVRINDTLHPAGHPDGPLGVAGHFNYSMQAKHTLDNASIEARTNSLALGDLDNDGDLDLVAGYSSAENLVWLNDGGGGFTYSGLAGHTLGLETTYTKSIALGDLDDDGDLDLVTGNINKPNLVWLNDGNSGFSYSGLPLHTLSNNDTEGDADTQSIALLDIDGDQDLDLFVGNGAYASEADSVWLNNGKGGFIDSGQALGEAYTRSVASGDVDGDGDPDIVSGSTSATHVWLNDY